jgi:hypothetical protein
VGNVSLAGPAGACNGGRWRQGGGRGRSAGRGLTGAGMPVSTVAVGEVGAEAIKLFG